MAAAVTPIPTRDRLVETARAYLDQEGVDGIGLREIARRAGVSHGAPLRHFPTLGALLAAVAADGFRDLYASVDGAVRGVDGGALDRLRAAAHGYVDFARTNPGVFALMFRADLCDVGDADYLTTGQADLDVLVDLATSLLIPTAARSESSPSTPDTEE